MKENKKYIRNCVKDSGIVDITVSLVSFNQRYDLERLLPSLFNATAKVHAEVLLVDCHSTDGTVQFIQEQFSEVDVYVNYKRAGYGENHNVNMERAKGRYFLIMNSDMVVEPNVLADLLDYMDENDDVGIVSSKILNDDSTIQGLNKRYPTIYDLFLRRFLPKLLLPIFKRRLDYYEMHDIGYNQSYDVPFLSGSFMFCRTDLLKKVGGFDPEYFLYFEDVDLCRRIQKTHRTVYYPYVSVVHFWKREAHKSWLFTYYFICSAFRYFNRWGYRLV
jgi:GT2 family glycosyltransferase